MLSKRCIFLRLDCMEQRTNERTNDCMYQPRMRVALFYCIESVVIRSQGYLSSDPAHWLSQILQGGADIETPPPDTLATALWPYRVACFAQSPFVSS